MLNYYLLKIMKRRSESEIADEFLVSASQQGWRLFRNNSGALKSPDGRWVRFGLGNISKEFCKKYKSADYIGVRPVLITSDMVGQTIGQFVSVEMKAEGVGVMKPAQAAWAKLIRSLGGYATMNNSGNL